MAYSDEDKLRASVEPLRAVEEARASARLVTAYKRAFYERYGITPVLNSGEIYLLETLYKNAGEQAFQIVSEYLTMKDEWFAKTTHSVKTLVNSLNTVCASLGAKKRALDATTGTLALDNIELFLRYVFDLGLTHGISGIYRVDDKTLAVGSSDGVRLSRDEIESHMAPYRGRGLMYHEVRDLFQALITSIVDSLESPPEDATF